MFISWYPPWIELGKDTHGVQPTSHWAHSTRPHWFTSPEQRVVKFGRLSVLRSMRVLLSFVATSRKWDKYQKGIWTDEICLGPKQNQGEMILKHHYSYNLLSTMVKWSYSLGSNNSVGCKIRSIGWRNCQSEKSSRYQIVAHVGIQSNYNNALLFLKPF